MLMKIYKTVKMATIKHTQKYVLNFSYFILSKFLISCSQEDNIVIGTDEIANNIKYLKLVLGENTISVNFSKHIFYQDNLYDYSFYEYSLWSRCYGLLYKPYLLAKLMCFANVFVYIWHTGFCRDRETDFNFLKKHNKKIICIFVGDDIRSRKMLLEYCNNNNLDTYVTYNNYDYIANDVRVREVARVADKYADMIFSRPLDQISYLKSRQLQFRFTVDTQQLKYNFKFAEGNSYTILHAPSDPITKGTQLVRAAIKKIQILGYNVKYIELTKKSNDEVLKILKSSCIVLDQFYALSHGLFCLEAMATGNAVLMSAYYEDMPYGAQNAWLKTGYWEIFDNLKYLLDNPQKIEGYAVNGRDYVEKYFSIVANKKYYKELFYKFDMVDIN